MRSIVLALALCLLPAIANAAAKKPGPVPNENVALAEAKTVVESFHAALKKGDRTGALNMLDDAVEVFEQGHIERSKAEYMSKHLDADIAFSAKTNRAMKSHGGAMLGNLAYFTSESTVTGTYKGQSVNSVSIETMVLHKAPKGWKILHIHWSSRDPAPAPAPASVKGTRGSQQ